MGSTLTAPIFQLLEDLDWHPGAPCLPPASPLTIYGKHVLDLLFNHAQCSLDAVRAGHGMDVVGIETAQIQYLWGAGEDGVEGLAFCSLPRTCPTPGPRCLLG